MLFLGEFLPVDASFMHSCSHKVSLPRRRASYHFIRPPESLSGGLETTHFTQMAGANLLLTIPAALRPGHHHGLKKKGWAKSIGIVAED